MLKKLSELIETRLKIAACELESLLEALNAKEARREWDEETGRMFNDMVLQYPISENELFRISEYACKFFGVTRLSPEKFRQYFFLDEECSKPRLPWMLYAAGMANRVEQITAANNNDDQITNLCE